MYLFPDRKGAPAIPGPGIVVPAPAEDFFSADPLRSITLAGLAVMVRECSRCPLCQDRTLAVPGEGPEDARLMVVA